MYKFVHPLVYFLNIFEGIQICIPYLPLLSVFCHYSEGVQICIADFSISFANVSLFPAQCAVILTKIRHILKMRKVETLLIIHVYNKPAIIIITRSVVVSEPTFLPHTLQLLKQLTLLFHRSPNRKSLQHTPLLYTFSHSSSGDIVVQAFHSPYNTVQPFL